MRAIALSLVACLAWFATGTAAAPDARSYAVLSLAGDKLNVIEHVAVTGSQIDRNNRQQIAVADGMFDVAVLRAVRDALHATGEVDLFQSRDARLYTLQDRSLESDELPRELTTAVGELVAKSKATHLIVVTKRATPVNLAVANGTVGEGKISGLGFYLDRDLILTNRDNGDKSTGFIAPFASMEVTLIDTRTLRTVRHVHATEARVYGASVSRTASAPWDILTPSQKVENLVLVIEAALREAVPKVVAGD